jgi:hypothetical protein
MKASIVALLCAALGAGAQAASYSESVNGELPSNRLAPFTWLLDAGDNMLQGSLNRAPTDVAPDRDYVHIVVPKGHLWQALIAAQDITVGGSGSFIGLAAGATMPVDPDTGGPEGLLGYKIYTPADAGNDILDDMALGSGAQGFTRPLAAGDYTLWIQELNPGTFNYGFNFMLTAIPEPASAFLLAAGLAALAGGRRLRRR